MILYLNLHYERFQQWIRRRHVAEWLVRLIAVIGVLSRKWIHVDRSHTHVRVASKCRRGPLFGSWGRHFSGLILQLRPRSGSV